jgi:hypothetical protein
VLDGNLVHTFIRNYYTQRDGKHKKVRNRDCEAVPRFVMQLILLRGNLRSFALKRTVQTLFIYLLLSLFLQPSADYGLLVTRDFVITHNDAPQSVGLLWTSDQIVAETST